MEYECVCARCGGRLILDYKTGYYVCGDCGTVYALAVYGRTFYDEEPAPRRMGPREREEARRLKRLERRYLDRRTREVEVFLSKLREMHPELGRYIVTIEATSVRRAARIAYRRLGIPYRDIKEAVRRSGVRVDVRLRDLGGPRPRRTGDCPGPGELREEFRLLRRVVGRILLAGIPEAKDAVAYVLACERLGLRADPDRAAALFHVNRRLVRRRLREVRRALQRPAHALVLQYGVAVEDAARLHGLPVEEVRAAVERYRALFSRPEPPPAPAPPLPGPVPALPVPGLPAPAAGLGEGLGETPIGVWCNMRYWGGTDERGGGRAPHVRAEHTGLFGQTADLQEDPEAPEDDIRRPH